MTWRPRRAGRGLLPHDLVLAAREESAVEQEAADVLWVDVPTLQVRLDHLHPAEQAWLTNQLADDRKRVGWRTVSAAR